MVAVAVYVTYSFDELVVPIRHEVLAYAISLCRDKHRGEDITQEVLIRALEAWDRFRVPEGADPERTVRAWLFTVTYNYFVNTWRRSKRARDIAEATPERLLEATYGTQDDGVDPRKHMTFEYDDEVSAALEALDKDQRAVIELSTAGASYKEIAAALHIPMGTVMSRLCRARRRLEAQLAEYADKNYGLRRASEDTAAGVPTEAPEPETDSIDTIVADDDGLDFVGAEPLSDSDASW